MAEELESQSSYNSFILASNWRVSYCDPSGAAAMTVRKQWATDGAKQQIKLDPPKMILISNLNFHYTEDKQDDEGSYMMLIRIFKWNQT